MPRRFGALVAKADLVILGSYVPDGIAIADWMTARARGVTAFYDIDTPVTLAGLEGGKVSYLSARLIPRFDLYLSFTGGPLLKLIEDAYGSPRARVLHCAAEMQPAMHGSGEPRWALGYLGTYSRDREAGLKKLLIRPARQLTKEHFVVAGPQYPSTVSWPTNVARIEHLPPGRHAEFYGQQRFTLNVTRADMVAAGYSPSVRLFEAAAAGVPIISDNWAGLDTFFLPGSEILTAESTEQVVQILTELPEQRRRDIAAAASARILSSHTPQHRARQLEDYYREVIADRPAKLRLEVVA